MVNKDVLMTLADNLFTAETVECSWWNRKISFKNCTLKCAAGPFPAGTFLERIRFLLSDDSFKAQLFVHRGDVRCVEMGFKGVWSPLDNGSNSETTDVPKVTDDSNQKN